MISLNLRSMMIHSAYKAQIPLLLSKKVTISTKYADFADFFSKKSAEVLSKRITINKLAINLVNDK